ncbi:hypothetical protein FKM82_016899 [Ascaphus truei]
MSSRTKYILKQWLVKRHSFTSLQSSNAVTMESVSPTMTIVHCIIPGGVLFFEIWACRFLQTVGSLEVCYPEMPSVTIARQNHLP